MSFNGAGKPVAFLYVNEREAALRFYRDLLGLELRSSDDFGDFLDAGGALVRMTSMAEHKASSHPVFGWEVPDIDAAARRLSERGVRLRIYEGMGQDELGIWTSPDGAAKVAWFEDPDGNVLSLSQT